MINQNFDPIQIRGYTTYYKNCYQSTRAGGVCFLVKDELDSGQIELGFGDKDDRFVLVKANKIYFEACYKQQMKSYIFQDQSYQNLENILRVIEDKGIILLGDFNALLHGYGSNNVQNEQENALSLQNCIEEQDLHIISNPILYTFRSRDYYRTNCNDQVISNYHINIKQFSNFLTLPSKKNNQKKWFKIIL